MQGGSYVDMGTCIQDSVKSLISKVSLSEQNFTSCHDLHVASTERILHLMKNSIRVDCSATYNAEYVPHKDISLPLSGLPFDLPAAGNDIHNRHLQILYSTSVSSAK
jgi:hypothetical protein